MPNGLGFCGPPIGKLWSSAAATDDLHYKSQPASLSPRADVCVLVDKLESSENMRYRSKEDQEQEGKEKVTIIGRGRIRCAVKWSTKNRGVVN
jgi:hypothetical protein